MADKDYVVSLQVNKQGAVENTEKVNTALATTKGSAASLKKELANLQKELATLDPNSEAFQKLAAQAGEVKDKLNDASEAVRANAGPAFANLGNNFSLLRGRLSELDFEGVGQSLKGVASNIANVKFDDLLKGAKGLVSGLAQAGKALLLNPIFLIGTIIAVAIANFDKLAKLVDGVSSSQEKAAEAAKESAVNAKEQLDNVSSIDNLLKLQGKSEKEILAIKLKAVDAAILAQKVSIQTNEDMLESQVAAAKRNKEILVGILNFVSAPLKLLLTGIDRIAAALGQTTNLAAGLDDSINSAANLVFDPAEVEKEGLAALKEQRTALTALENQKAGFILSGQKADSDAAAARAELRQKELDDLHRVQEEVFKLQQAAMERAKELGKVDSGDRLSKLRSEADEENRLIQEQADLKLQLLAEGKDKEIAMADQAAIKLREQAGTNAELLKQVAEKNQADVDAINKKYADADLKRQQELADAKIKYASFVNGAITEIVSNLNVKNEKQARAQFAIGKAVAIADTLIKTYQAAQTAYASTVPGPGFLIRAVANAGIAVAAGLSKVNAIRKQRFGDSGSAASAGGGGGSDAPSTSGTPSTSAPQAFNPLDTSFLNNRPPQAQPAYIVAKQANSALGAQQLIDQQNRL